MGQLKTLLWKNFRWCYRHPLKTALFYVFPLCLSGFLLMISQLLGVEFSPDCDYQTMALPPSHPALFVQSLVCSEPTACLNKTAGYKPVHDLMDHLAHSAHPENDTNSKLCPDQTGRGYLGKAMMACMEERPEFLTYRNLPIIDMVYRGQILYYPPSEAATNITQKMQAYLDQISSLQMGAMLGNSSNESSLAKGLYELGMATVCYRPLANRTFTFASRADAVRYAHDELNFTAGDTVWGLVHFERTSADFRYTVVSHFDQREKHGVTVLQALVEAAVVELKTGRKADYNLEHKLLPVRCRKNEAIYGGVMAVMQLLVSLGVLVGAHSLASEMCFEKGAGLLEFLFIAGVSRATIKLAWFLFGLVFLPTVCLLIGAIFKYHDPLIIEHTEFSVICAFFFLYGCSLLCLCFCVASVMSTAQKAGIMVIVLLVMAWLPVNWAQILPQVGYIDNILFVRTVSLLHCSVTAQIGIGYMVEWEKLEVGANWDNLSKSPIQDDNYAGLLEAMLHLIVQCPFYMLLSWYFDHTAPSKYGFKSPWYFPFTSSYWFGAGQSEPLSPEAVKEQTADIEETPENEKKPAGVAIQNLTKCYGGVFTALDHLTLTLNKNEVTALLGHNGAGKSTTMNMLTGMIMPSDGTALVDEKDIRTEMAEVRKNLGFCPQYDIVYPELTVEEHIRFYGELKGIAEEDYIGFSSELFRQMKMDHAVKTAAMNLSGGMKRKLSIAISFLGNPTTVILDEPTSAIDPFSRRAIWDVVLSYKDRTTCLISTHYMQEADILGDRIAIVNHGQLKCFGTTMYLKNKYGSGFFLKLAHQAEINAKEIEAKLQEFVPVSLVGSTKTETTMTLPLTSARSVTMVDAFRYLETDAHALGVVSFGISESTMEQVFFKVAADDVDVKGGSAEINKHEDESMLRKITYDNISGATLLATQCWAVWVKRYHLAKRSKIGLIFQILMPLVFTMVLLFLNNVMAETGRNGDRIHMHPWNTSSVESMMFYSGPRNGTYLQSWLNYGLGTRCMYSGAIPDKPCDQKVTPLLPENTNDRSTTEECACRKCPNSLVSPAKKAQLQTSADYLLNLSGRNVSRYLLKVNEVEFTGGIEIFETKMVNGPTLARNLPLSVRCMFEPFLLTPQELMDGEGSCFDMAQLIAMFLGGGREDGGGGGGSSGGLFGFGNSSNGSGTDNGGNGLFSGLFGFGTGNNGGMSPADSVGFGTSGNETNGTRVKRQIGFGGGGGGSSGGGGGGAPSSGSAGMAAVLVKYAALLKSVPAETRVIWTGMPPLRGGGITKRQKDLRYMTAAYLNAYSNVELRANIDPMEDPLSYGISFFTEELSMTKGDLSIVSIISGIMLGMFSSIALVMPTFTPLLIATTEHASGTKQLQFLMGMSRAVYWTANFTWDIVLYSGSVGLVILFMVNFRDVFSQDMEMYFYCCMAFGVGMILSAYVISLLLKQGHVAILLEFIFTPFFTIASLVMFSFRDKDWYETVDTLLSGLPPYFISISLTTMAIYDMIPDTEPMLSWDMLGKRFAAVGTWSLLMVSVLFAIESGLFDALTQLPAVQSLLGGQCLKNAVDVVEGIESVKDADVLQEEETVNAPGGDAADGGTVLAVKRILKRYRGGKMAVNDVSFGVNKNECFGLLGVNGAGKSTLFKMLTGFHKPSGGDASINGYSIFKSASEVTRYMSYCPQEDVLFESLTPAEHVNFYGRVRGIPANERDELSQVLISEVGLDEHLAKLAGELSGGNKRKLNFAVAMLDFPDCIFLDEMTTGMDPKARRSAWHCLQKAMAAGCAAVITSHSMEECELLCNRLVIMVNGQFKCIGGVQYLKDKYGKSYSAKFRTAANTDLEVLLEKITSQFPGSSLVERHLNYLEVQIPTKKLHLSSLYSFIHAIKDEFMFDDFTVSQTTLEHVFVNMVKNQE